jgi:hypothetical protein
MSIFLRRPPPAHSLLEPVPFASLDAEKGAPLKLVMTLLCRDEEDIVDSMLAFHLNAGVDFVIATDHASHDGTTEILERYAREGYLRLIREEDSEYREVQWRTRMARLAATEYQAEWVINSDADEFWWPRGLDLKDVVGSVPQRYGVVRAFWRPFVPRPDDGAVFSERMIVRVAPDAAIHDPGSQFRPKSKVIHRASPSVTIGRGNHDVEGVSFEVLHGWYPVELLHFPLRSHAQVRRKASIYRATSDTRLHDAHRNLHRAFESGDLADRFRALAVDDEALKRGLADGTLVVDTRLRDALRSLVRPTAHSGTTAAQAFALPQTGRGGLRFERPSIADDARYAVDAAVLGEADVVRAQRRLDELEQRIAVLERKPWPRLMRRLRRVRRGAPVSRRS